MVSSKFLRHPSEDRNGNPIGILQVDSKSRHARHCFWIGKCLQTPQNLTYFHLLTACGSSKWFRVIRFQISSAPLWWRKAKIVEDLADPVVLFLRAVVEGEIWELGVSLTSLQLECGSSIGA